MIDMIDITYEIRTDIGTRDEQQDYAFASKNDGIVFAVLCDGMGGHKGGAIASKTAVKELSKRITNFDKENIPGFFINSLEDINSIVYNLRDDRKRRLNAGTTIVSIIIDNNKLYWISAGDSRLYIIRSGHIKQITNDHNLYLSLDSLLKGKKITKEEYQERSSKGNALISYLGVPQLELLDANIQPFLLLPNDYMLLTSDGLYKLMNEEMILQCMCDNTERFADSLMKNVKEAISEIKDNTTFILLKVLEKSL